MHVHYRKSGEDIPAMMDCTGTTYMSTFDAEQLGFNLEEDNF